MVQSAYIRQWYLGIISGYTGVGGKATLSYICIRQMHVKIFLGWKGIEFTPQGHLPVMHGGLSWTENFTVLYIESLSESRMVG